MDLDGRFLKVRHWSTIFASQCFNYRDLFKLYSFSICLQPLHWRGGSFFVITRYVFAATLHPPRVPPPPPGRLAKVLKSHLFAGRRSCCERIFCRQTAPRGDNICFDWRAFGGEVIWYKLGPRLEDSQVTRKLYLSFRLICSHWGRLLIFVEKNFLNR